MNVIEAAFRPLRDAPCWNVKPGYGSFLTMEFGEPHLSIREPLSVITAKSPRVRKALSRRMVTAHGQWHLWIYCCAWKVVHARKIIGDWSTARRRKAAAAELEGQKLAEVVVNRRRSHSIFEFEFGSRLVTWPYDRESEQWLLYEPNGFCLTFRYDGLDRRRPSNADPSEGTWQRP